MALFSIRKGQINLPCLFSVQMKPAADDGRFLLMGYFVLTYSLSGLMQ